MGSNTAKARLHDVDDTDDLFENAPCGLIYAQGNGSITRINQTFLTWTGQQQGQVVGRRLSDLLNVAGKIYYATHIAPLLRMQGFFDEIALDFVCANGAVLPTLVNAVERRDGSGELHSVGLAVFKAPDRRRYERELLEARRAAEQAQAEMRDSEAKRRELQAKLLHVARLSTAGEMAAALTHELNQPLTAVASAVWAAQSMVTPASLREGPEGGTSPELCEILEFAGEQAVRAGQIVRSMRDFVTKRRDTDRRLEDFGKLTEAAGTLALVDAKERGVDVTFRIHPKLPPVLVDRIQIQQVLLNLMRNALEAMVPDGEGDGATTPRRNRPELTVAASASGPEVVEVAVADTGPGLAPEVADRLFGAFVSTKPDGMGLGLSICHSIVEAHGGRLWVDSNPGGGAIFRFTLPTGPRREEHEA